MTKPRLLITAVAAFAAAALLALAACSSSGHEQANQSSAPTSMSAPQAHNQADVMFAQHMIPHHQQAIEMSDIVLGKQEMDPRVVDLADKIKAAQGPEIQQMRSWLSQWGQPTMPMMPGGSMMPSGSVMPGMQGMEGMMSSDDMAALKNAQGTDASKVFLQRMIQHHQGAITMAQNEINTGQYTAAIALARSIVTSQQQEINTMQSILGSM